MTSIKNIIKEAVLKEANSTIKIDESHFFSVLAEPKNKKKFFSFLFLLTTIIISVVVIINSLVFFINDVLLYPNTPTVNKQGAIIPERSCNRQSVLFLFNSAERWVNTGIQLQKGDEIKISFSGGFHSDIAGLKKAVETNDALKHKWVTSSVKEKPEDSRKNLLYNKEDGYFGSILYTIASEYGVQSNNKFYQIEKEKLIRIKQNGNLFLSVNDIYLTNSVIAKYENDNIAKFKTEFIDSFQFGKKGGRDKIVLFWMKNKDTIYVSGHEFHKHFYNNRDAFFNDNLGEILVVIDINRKVDIWSWRTSWYRFAENKINDIYEKHTNNICAFSLSVLFFICAIFVLLFVRLWFITIPLLLLFGYPIAKKYFQKLKKRKQ